MNKISEKQLERYPIYLKYLLDERDSGSINISSPKIAKDLSLSEEQVRKDLQAVTKNSGKPKSGRDINELIHDIQVFLNYDKLTKACVVGVGHLGQALLNYSGFNNFGLDIVTGFDVDSELIGKKINGVEVCSIYQIASKIEEKQIEVAILSTPSEVAQEVANRLVNAGIKGIWNFVPVHIKVNNNVAIENINMASSFAILKHKLQNGD